VYRGLKAPRGVAPPLEGGDRRIERLLVDAA
jgi:hypothetical protein